MIRIFLLALFCVQTTEINTTHGDETSDISDMVTYYKKLITKTIKVLKDVIPIDEDTLWCTHSSHGAEEHSQQTPASEEEWVRDDTCPVQENEKLPICNKYEDQENTLEALADTRSKYDNAPRDIREAEKHYDSDFAMLIREYADTKEQCKEAVSANVKQMCKELDGNMQKLFQVHDTLQELRNRASKYV